MFRDLFDVFRESTKLINDFEKFVEENEKKESLKKDEEKNHSYYHYVSDKYEDGQHVSHKEKEVKDGKVVKDVNNSMNIEDKNDKKKICGDKCNDENIDLKKKIECFINTNKELKTKIEMLEDINNKLQHEKHELEMKLAKIKSMF